MEATFFDPALAELQRQLQHNMTTGIADLGLKDQRTLEDANLMRPFMERRFAKQMEQTAGNVAGRGFHGSESGVMRDALGDLGEEQAFARGQFEKGVSRERDDIARAASQLTQQATMSGAEGVRGGAGRATDRAVQALPF